jgi:hypothetical protein
LILFVTVLAMVSFGVLIVYSVLHHGPDGPALRLGLALQSGRPCGACWPWLMMLAMHYRKLQNSR